MSFEDIREANQTIAGGVDIPIRTLKCVELTVKQVVNRRLKPVCNCFETPNS